MAEKGFSDQGGRGRKQCPSCQKFVGARHTGKCPNPKCSHEFVAKAKKVDSKQRTLPTLALDAQLDAIKALGGVEKLKEHIAALDAATKALEPFGGADKAYEVLRVIERVAELTAPEKKKK